MNAITPTRPVLRWHGGKWLLATWIISHFPKHRVYVEPFGGAASVLLRKDRAKAEVYNDLDFDVVNLFRVLQDPAKAARLRELLVLTPFARAEFDLSYAPSDDDIETARRLIIRSYMGFGSNAHATSNTGRAQTGFRSNSTRSGTTPAQDWQNYPDCLDAIIERMRGVIIESRDALTVAATHDGLATLHYFDPPYQLELRNPGNPYEKKHMYRHEMDRGGARLASGGTENPDGHGAAVRLSRYSVRRRLARLAAHRTPRACRWRAPAHRGAVDQPGLRASAGPHLVEGR